MKINKLISLSCLTFLLALPSPALEHSAPHDHDAHTTGEHKQADDAAHATSHETADTNVTKEEEKPYRFTPKKYDFGHNWDEGHSHATKSKNYQKFKQMEEEKQRLKDEAKHQEEEAKRIAEEAAKATAAKAQTKAHAEKPDNRIKGASHSEHHLGAHPLTNPQDDSFFEPPEAQNKYLDKVVNFNFKRTKLSEILLLLSKVGEFNVVLPESLDPVISIAINNKKIINAISDIVEVSELKYVFKDNTLIISDKDISAGDFASVPVLYSDAKELAKSINNNLFRQIIMSQEAHAFKPYAFHHPAENKVIIAGNHEQIKTARELIEELDSNKYMDFYSPEFLKPEDVRKVIDLNLDFSNIQLSTLSNKSLMLKGIEKEVKEAMRIIKRHDVPPKHINFVLEVLKVEEDLFDEYYTINNIHRIFAENEATKINDYLASTDDFRELSNYLNTKYRREFELTYRNNYLAWNHQITARRNMVQPELYSITAFDRTLEHMNNNDILGYLSRVSNLYTVMDTKDLKNERKLKDDDLVLILIKEVIPQQ